MVPMSGFFFSAEILVLPRAQTPLCTPPPPAATRWLVPPHWPGIRVMLESLPQQAAEKGDYPLQKIGMLRNKYPHILKDIRRQRPAFGNGV